MYLAKVTEYLKFKKFKNIEFKILTISPGVVAAIRVRGDPCGAVRWTDIVQRTAPQGSPRTPATSIAATTPELIVGILNSVFLNFLNF